MPPLQGSCEDLMEVHPKQQPRRFSWPGGEEEEEVTPGFQGQPLETQPQGHKGSFLQELTAPS